MAKRFHLGWFVSFTPGDWDNPVATSGPRWDGQYYVDMARALERACFDYIMLEDTLMVSEAYRGTSEATLKNALEAPKHDPLPLAAIIASQTRHLGIVATMSTLAYPPFLLARLASTLDHLSGGRFGWNIVTSGEDATAQNFGLDELPPRQVRYDMADEYMDVVCKLFDSWAPDAVLRDHATGVYADHTKVKPIHHHGTYFKVRGPLNTERSPQGRPVFVQAGGSPRGRAFAARHADSIVALGNGVAGMKAYRDDVRARAAAAGRDPDDIKVLFLVYPFIGETEQAARDSYSRLINSPRFIERSLTTIGIVTDIDFSQYDLDAPLPPVTTNGEQGSLDKFAQWGSGKTLRQLASERFESSLELIGTPDQVADKMGAAIEAIGGDGFLINTPFQLVHSRAIIDVTQGLVPALQRRGLVRTGYTQATLRETLREF